MLFTIDILANSATESCLEVWTSEKINQKLNFLNLQLQECVIIFKQTIKANISILVHSSMCVELLTTHIDITMNIQYASRNKLTQCA